MHQNGYYCPQSLFTCEFHIFEAENFTYSTYLLHHPTNYLKMKKISFLTIAFILGIFSVNTVFAQISEEEKDPCNPEEWVESFYEWGKSWENYILDYFPITVEEEETIGDSLHVAMGKENILLDRHFKQDFLNKVLSRIVPHVERKGITYDIHVIDDNKTLNAFSIAGGHLYITSKMIDWVESEDELAFILAHEVAHVDNKHSLRKVQKLIVGETFLGDYGILAANLQILVSSPFGQIDEYDADKTGANLASKAGYNPRKGLRFFEKMAAGEQFDIVEKIIRTHPYSAERHDCLDSYIADELEN